MTTPTPTGVERLCYQFAPVNQTYGAKLLVYTGLVKSLGPTEAIPDDCAPHAPAGLIDTGMAAYWNGSDWIVLKDLRVLQLPQHRAINQTALDLQFTVNAASLSQGYTEAEKWTWASQEADARAYVATGVATYLLQSLAGANNYTLEVLCQRILYKADLYRRRYSDVLARYQASSNKLQAISSKEELPALSLQELQAALKASS